MRIDWSVFGAYKLALLIALIGFWILAVSYSVVVFSDFMQVRLRQAESMPLADFRYWQLTLQALAPVIIPFVLGGIVVFFAFYAVFYKDSNNHGSR